MLAQLSTSALRDSVTFVVWLFLVLFYVESAINFVHLHIPQRLTEASKKNCSKKIFPSLVSGKSRKEMGATTAFLFLQSEDAKIVRTNGNTKDCEAFSWAKLFFFLELQFFHFYNKAKIIQVAVLVWWSVAPPSHYDIVVRSSGKPIMIRWFVSVVNWYSVAKHVRNINNHHFDFQTTLRKEIIDNLISGCCW